MGRPFNLVDLSTHERVCLSVLCLIQIHVLRTFRDFIIKVLDFQSHMAVVRILQVALEQQIPLCL